MGGDPVVDDVLHLLDDGEVVQPQHKRKAQSPRQGSVHSAGPAMPTSVRLHAPGGLLALFDGEAGSLADSRLLKWNDRHAVAAIEGFQPPDRQRSEASATVENQGQATGDQHQ